MKRLDVDLVEFGVICIALMALWMLGNAQERDLVGPSDMSRAPGRLRLVGGRAAARPGLSRRWGVSP
jgi:hypothetical protein